MNTLENIKQQVRTLQQDEKQELRYFINQTLRENNILLFKRREAMRQIQTALTAGFQF